MDLSYLQADVKLDAIPLPAGAKMSLTDYSKIYNEKLEIQRKSRSGLIRDCGKSWCLSNRLAESYDKAINYGFYSKNGKTNNAGIKLYQQVGGAHNLLHQDYSQCIFLLSSQCLLNGEMIDITNVMQHPKLASLINYEGVLRFIKQSTSSVDIKLCA